MGFIPIDGFLIITLFVLEKMWCAALNCDCSKNGCNDCCNDLEDLFKSRPLHFKISF